MFPNTTASQRECDVTGLLPVRSPSFCQGERCRCTPTRARKCAFVATAHAAATPEGPVIAQWRACSRADVHIRAEVLDTAVRSERARAQEQWRECQVLPSANTHLANDVSRDN
ncbi:hypothetical protein HPB50_003579 [Hyalomma asiaticum]|uniref:Uncharacterized protein n=1 Tax=Hyalomma asiaticum TaxID=266040 RepID=A0ACB7SV71_HYAAI|nr:hypothetical protein HPB50_003579 [Hyalomma asiaticum]